MITANHKVREKMVLKTTVLHIPVRDENGSKTHYVLQICFLTIEKEDNNGNIQY